MGYDREAAWDILAEFNGAVDGGFTPVGYIGVDNSEAYDSALDQLAALGDGFDRDAAWEILVEFSMLADGSPTPVGEIGVDNTAAFDSALDQLAGCYQS